MVAWCPAEPGPEDEKPGSEVTTSAEYQDEKYK